MNSEDFNSSSAGKCIKTLEGYWAFVPSPLPLEIAYDKETIRLLSDADRLLGELSGIGKLLPNPYLLISPYIRREAVASSHIEGTRASLHDLYYFEATGREKPDKKDVLEVENYVKAMQNGLNLLQKLPVSVRLICEIHSVLMKNVRGGYASPGELRRSQNWIGPLGCTLDNATYVPPPVDEMKQSLSELERFLNTDLDMPPLIQCALMHYQFEAIHPFLDGNGRIGRLLITFFLCERGILPQPLLYLSTFFDAYRDEYYRNLIDVSRYGKWHPWIRFFLRGIAVQAKSAIDNSREILLIYDEYIETLKRTKKIPDIAFKLIDELFVNPVISIPELCKRWKLAYNTVKRGVQRLQQLEIIHEITENKRNRLFVARKLMNILMK